MFISKSFSASAIIIAMVKVMTVIVWYESVIPVIVNRKKMFRELYNIIVYWNILLSEFFWVTLHFLHKNFASVDTSGKTASNWSSHAELLATRHVKLKSGQNPWNIYVKEKEFRHWYLLRTLPRCLTISCC